MSHPYWNDLYFSWGWFLWLGFILLFFSSFGNWGYTYRAHRRFGGLQGGGRWTSSTSAMRVARSIASSTSGSRPTSPADPCLQAPERGCDRPERGLLSDS